MAVSTSRARAIAFSATDVMCSEVCGPDFRRTMSYRMFCSAIAQLSSFSRCAAVRLLMSAMARRCRLR